MSKTAMIRARVEPGLKVQAEGIFDAIGLSVTDAITLFYRQVQIRSGLPFDVLIPNSLTRKTMRATDKGRGLVKAKNAEDMFKKLSV
jgi:DNA-damage-inducible protein J